MLEIKVRTEPFRTISRVPINELRPTVRCNHVEYGMPYNSKTMVEKRVKGGARAAVLVQYCTVYGSIHN